MSILGSRTPGGWLALAVWTGLCAVPAGGQEISTPVPPGGGSAAPAASGAKPTGSTRGPLVYVIPIKDGPKQAGGMIDYWLAGYVERKVQEAIQNKADVIILEIDTNGGMVDACIEIGKTMDKAVAAKIPSVAFVTTKAWSGGAYVALTCDRIYMQNGSTMGSAQVVAMSGGKAEALGEKYTSAVRKQFRARAEMKPRHKPYYPLWMAMVDPKKEVIEITYTEKGKTIRKFFLKEGYRKDDYKRKRNLVENVVVAKGTLLNVSFQEALDYGLIDGTVLDRDDLIQKLGLTTGGPGGSAVTPQIRETLPTFGDEMARFLSGQIPSSLLILIGMLALALEIKGVVSGVGALVFGFCLGLFFWCNFVAGQASGVEILIFLVGVILLGVEVFVVPGFGVFGITGIVLILGSLVLSFLPEGYLLPEVPDLLPRRWEFINEAFLSVFLSLALSMVLLTVLARYVRLVPVLGRVVLETTIESTVDGQGRGEVLNELVGQTGVALTVLRPAGKVEINGRPFSVVSPSQFIEQGDLVRVLSVSGSRIVVERDAAGPAEA